jgi:hypothetical protein
MDSPDRREDPVNPIRTLRKAITLPFTALFVVGLCFFINWTTAPGHWWVQWVALGMGIAVVCAWIRALRVLIAGGALAVIGAWAYRHWGDDGRRRVQAWLDAGTRDGAN